MVCFEISANGKSLSNACVGETDQFEVALAKPIGDRDTTLSSQCFPLFSLSNKNTSWETDQVAVGDEIVIRIIEDNEGIEPYVKSNEDLEKEKESATFAHSVGKGT